MKTNKLLKKACLNHWTSIVTALRGPDFAKERKSLKRRFTAPIRYWVYGEMPWYFDEGDGATGLSIKEWSDLLEQANKLSNKHRFHYMEHVMSAIKAIIALEKNALEKSL